MDSEAQGAIARLNGLLDELDDMYVSSVGNLENRLSVARSAIEKARRNRGGKPQDVKSISETTAASSSPESDAERVTLLERISQYEKQVAELEATVAESVSKDARIAELEGLADEVSKRDAAIAELKDSLEKYKQRESRYEGLDAKLDEYNEKIKALESAVQQREDQVKEVAAQVQERDAQIASLREQIQEREQQTKGSEDTVAGLEKELEASKAQMQALNEQLQGKDEEIKAQQEAAILLKDEVRQREASIAKLEEKIQQGNADAAALREQLEKIQADNAVEDLQRDLSEKTDKVKSLEGALRTTEEDRAKLELEVKMLLGEIEGMRYQNSELEMLQGKVAKLETNLQEERAKVVRLKAKQTTAAASAEANETVAPASASKPVDPEESATKRIGAAAGKGRRGARKQMGEILVEAGVLTEEQLREVIAFQATDPKRKLGSVVVERGYATEEVIAAALAAQMHVRFIENLDQELQPGVIKLVPNHLINNHRCVPLSLNAGQLLVAMSNPLDLIGIENIELATNLRVEVAAATPSEIDQVIEKYFNRMKAYQ
jgi:chromosome segregation ATPase